MLYYNTVLHIQELLREQQILKVIITRKHICNYVDVNQTYCGDFTIYANIKSYHSIPETSMSVVSEVKKEETEKKKKT